MSAIDKVGNDPRIGQRFSRYQIVQRLGGNLAAVYKARDRELERFLVLKFLPVCEADQGAIQEAIERFRREARAASALDHQNICGIYEIGSEAGEMFIAMPFYERGSLCEEIRRGPVDVVRTIACARQLAEGLGAAHAKGIVHRDIKPGNIAFAADGTLKILDFGIARLSGSPTLTKPGSFLGTYGYAAPEQLRGEALDPRTDLWALGVVMYEMLAGKNPFLAGSIHETIFNILFREPPLLVGIPAGLDRVIRGLLAKSPDGRYGSAEEVLQDLRRANEGEDALPSDREVQDSPAAREVELASVLLMDIERFARLPMDQGLKLVDLLARVVAETDQFGRDDSSRHPIPLDIGDGIALVFFGNTQAAVACAIQVSRKLRRFPELRLRMGIHFGPVFRRTDCRGNDNVSGDAINLAERVANWGDAGHILLSGEMAKVVGCLGEWRPKMHILGEVAVKHGQRVQLTNLHAEGYGNPKTPRKLTRYRWQKRAMLMGVLLLISMVWFLMSAKVSTRVEAQALYVKSSVVPAELSLDGVPITILTVRSPSTTVSTSPGEHTIRLRAPAFAYHRRILLRPGDPIRLILVDKEQADR